jgi:uncharacterized membrane protein
MALLCIAALIWLGLHIGIAGTRVRDAAVAKIGDRTFGGLFSLFSAAALAFLIWAWSVAETTPLWFVEAWLRWLLVAVMLAAFLLLVASLSGPNPTMLGGPTATAKPLQGIQRITRHPMLWSFALWAGVHMIGNGDTAALVFFGAFLVTAFAGMPSIDAKLARRDPASWQVLAAATSIVPFAAIVQGRNRFAPEEIGWLTPLVAVVAWAIFLSLHGWLFGAAPVAI